MKMFSRSCASVFVRHTWKKYTAAENQCQDNVIKKLFGLKIISIIIERISTNMHVLHDLMFVFGRSSKEKQRCRVRAADERVLVKGKGRAASALFNY